MRIRFESTRVSAAILAEAYEQLVPMRRRRVGHRERPAPGSGQDRREA